MVNNSLAKKSSLDETDLKYLAEEGNHDLVDRLKMHGRKVSYSGMRTEVLKEILNEDDKYLISTCYKNNELDNLVGELGLNIDQIEGIAKGWLEIDYRNLKPETKELAKEISGSAHDRREVGKKPNKERKAKIIDFEEAKRDLNPKKKLRKNAKNRWLRKAGKWAA